MARESTIMKFKELLSLIALQSLHTLFTIVDIQVVTMSLHNSFVISHVSLISVIFFFAEIKS